VSVPSRQSARSRSIRRGIPLLPSWKTDPIRPLQIVYPDLFAHSVALARPTRAWTCPGSLDRLSFGEGYLRRVGLVSE
jgi:hypothetical protein